jgi:alanyl aminopeptidase
VQALFANQKKLVPGYERAMAQTEESINLCIAQKAQGQKLISSL